MLIMKMRFHVVFIRLSQYRICPMRRMASKLKQAADVRPAVGVAPFLIAELYAAIS